MKVVSSHGKFKTWSNNDPGFYFSPDNMTLIPRAAFQISDKCPREYRLIISSCLANGWLTPVAHQPVQEHFLEELTQ